MSDPFAVRDLFDVISEFGGMRWVWDPNGKLMWEIDQVPCEGGGMPREPPHISPDQIFFREYQLSFAITGVWTW